MQIELLLGDITEQRVDAIVNAANTTLLGGGGVDGAIHRAAGPELLEECRLLSGCKTGEAKITKGYHLPAKFVIHTVGPIWRGGTAGEDRLLRSCYWNVMKLAEQHEVKSIAFPSISTGAYGYPIERAARIAVRTIQDYAQESQKVNSVVFVCYSKSDVAVYERILGKTCRGAA